MARHIVLITYFLVCQTRSQLDKNRYWFIFQRRKETVVHPFPKTDASRLRVNPDCRHNSYIYFIYFSMTVSGLKNPEFSPFHRVSEWYHLETFALHKRQIHLLAALPKPANQRTQVGFALKGPEQQNRCVRCVCEALFEATLHLLVMPISHLASRPALSGQAVCAKCRFVHLKALCDIMTLILTYRLTHTC